MPSSVRVLGRARLQRTLKKAGLDMGDFKETNTVLASRAAAIIRGFVPERSGKLAGSVRGSKAKTKVSVMAGRKAVPYAGPINYGWPSRPNAAKGWRGGPIEGAKFLKSGGDAAQPMVVAGWTNHLQKILNTVKGM